MVDEFERRPTPSPALSVATPAIWKKRRPPPTLIPGRPIPRLHCLPSSSSSTPSSSFPWLPLLPLLLLLRLGLRCSDAKKETVEADVPVRTHPTDGSSLLPSFSAVSLSSSSSTRRCRRYRLLVVSVVQVASLLLLTWAPPSVQGLRNFTTELLEPQMDVFAVSAGGMAIFIGYAPPDYNYYLLDAYNTTADAWLEPRLATRGMNSIFRLSAAESVRDLAIFLGEAFWFLGGTSVDIYNATSNTYTREPEVSHAEMENFPDWTASTSVGDRYALFGGGWIYGRLESDPQGPTDHVHIYDIETDAWSISQLSLARSNLAAASVGHLAFFAGGRDSSSATLDVVDVFNSTDSGWTTDTLSEPRSYLTGTSVGELVLFAGGWIVADTVCSDVVDIYDVGTGTWSIAHLSVARAGLYATSTSGLAFFAGGYNASGHIDVVDIFNSSSGLWSSTRLSVARGGIGVTAAGGLVFFAGGSTDGYSGLLKLVEVLDTRAASPSPSPASTPSPGTTPSPSESPSPSASESPSVTASPSASTSTTPSASPSPTSSESPSSSATPSPSESASASPSPSPSSSPSESPSWSASPPPTGSPTPSNSATPSVSVSPSSTGSPSPSESMTPSASATPSQSPSSSVTPSVSRSPSPSCSSTPTVSPSPSMTRTPSPSPSRSASNTPSPSSSVMPYHEGGIPIVSFNSTRTGDDGDDNSAIGDVVIIPTDGEGQAIVEQEIVVSFGGCIRELNSVGSVIQEGYPRISLSDGWKSVNESSFNSRDTYLLSLPINVTTRTNGNASYEGEWLRESAARLEVQLDVFDNHTTIHQGSVSMTAQPSLVKFTIRLFQWPWHPASQEKADQGKDVEQKIKDMRRLEMRMKIDPPFHSFSASVDPQLAALTTLVLGDQFTRGARRHQARTVVRLLNAIELDEEMVYEGHGVGIEVDVARSELVLMFGHFGNSSMEYDPDLGVLFTSRGSSRLETGQTEQSMAMIIGVCVGVAASVVVVASFISGAVVMTVMKRNRTRVRSVSTATRVNFDYDDEAGSTILHHDVEMPHRRKGSRTRYHPNQSSPVTMSVSRKC